MEMQRPVTRWRREYKPPSRAGGENDRPLSRRGSVNTLGSGNRPRVVVRPPTGSVMYPRSNSRISSANMQSDRIPRERLISQQGLGGLHTASSKGQVNRQVQDRRYFHGILKMKMGQLTNEMNKLRKQIEVDSREQASYLTYEKQVKEMATELTEAQRKLTDYNLVMDKVNTGASISKLISETKELMANNEVEVGAVEMLFTDRLRRQEAIAKMEAEIYKENSKAENLISEMGPIMKEQYSLIKNTNVKLSQELEELKKELDSLSKSKSSIGEKLYLSLGKSHTVRSTKYLDLKRREEAMEDFLSTAELSKKEEMEKLSSLEVEIMAVLDDISQKLFFLPTDDDFRSLEQFNSDLKMDLLNTTKSLTAEHKNMSLFLNKVEMMDNKIKADSVNLKSKVQKMREEIVTFSNIEKLQGEIDNKRKDLLRMKDELSSTQQTKTSGLKDAASKYNFIQQKLVENEANAQLIYLERKLTSVEQSNFIMKTYLSSIHQEEDISMFHSAVMNVMKRLNLAFLNVLKNY